MQTEFDSEAMQQVVGSYVALEPLAFVSRQMLLVKLTEMIMNLLQQNPAHLVQLLYRLDVDEEAAISQMQSGQADSAAMLAELMLARYERIVSSRRQSRSEQAGGTLEGDEDLSW